MSSQIFNVTPQLNRSEITAIPYVESALPTYVQEFNTPETVDTFPYRLKNAGIMQTKITFTPCMEPAKTADPSTEMSAALPLNKSIRTVATAPVKKMIPPQSNGFLNFLR